MGVGPRRKKAICNSEIAISASMPLAREIHRVSSVTERFLETFNDEQLKELIQIDQKFQLILDEAIDHLESVSIEYKEEVTKVIEQ